VRLVTFDRIPNNLELPRISRLCAHLRHSYAAKSSARDFWTSGAKATLTR
jgi:hypothetical protein